MISCRVMKLGMLLLVLLGVGCRREPTIVIRFEPLAVDGGAKSSAPPVTPSCATDTDCALAPEDCCDCNHGGRLRARPKAAIAREAAANATRCKETMCAAMMSSDSSCVATAVCVRGVCALSSRDK